MVGEVGPTSVELSWSEQSGVESYQVSYGGVINSCGGQTPSGATVGNTRGVTLTNLEEDSVYSVTVTAMSGDDAVPTIIMITTAEAGNVHTIIPYFYNVQYFTVPATFLPSAPSSPPQDFSMTNHSSSIIDLQWMSIECLNRNTEITGYTVRYGSVSDSDDITEVSVDGPASGVTTYMLSGLTPFTNYFIEVAGNSAHGHGPFSDAIFQITDEARELIFHMSHLSL